MITLIRKNDIVVVMHKYSYSTKNSHIIELLCPYSPKL